MTAQGQVERSGPSLGLVLGSVAVLSIVFGVLAYKRYADSEAWVQQGIKKMDAEGANLDVQGCIDAAIKWHAGCEENDANQAVCNHAVKIEMYHCLSATDRAAECEADWSNPPEKGSWVYGACEERGNRCINKRECACAEAYRATDSFCKTGQKAVQL